MYQQSGWSDAVTDYYGRGITVQRGFFLASYVYACTHMYLCILCVCVCVYVYVSLYRYT